MSSPPRGSAPIVADLTTPGVLADPSPTYQRLRRAEGPARSPDGAWLVSRYADVHAALRRPEVFSCAETNGRRRRELAVLVGVDPPEHTRLRGLTAGFFGPTARARWAPVVLDQVHDVVADAAQARTFDAVERLCAAIPLAVLAALMGVGRAELAGLVRSNARDRRRQLAGFFQAQLEHRRRRPGSDLISHAAEARGEGPGLTDQEIVGHCVLLLSAGLDAPRDLLANILIELDAGQGWGRLAMTDTARAGYVEECLRYFAPVQGAYRTIRAPFVDRGWRMERGDRALLLIGSANRDETLWSDAEVFRPARYEVRGEAPAHLGLGLGAHACLGATLARLTTAAALQALAERELVLRGRGPVVRGHNPCFRRVVRWEVGVEP